jgi:hypothetical protein
MLISDANNFRNALARIALWLGSLLLAVTIFSLFFIRTGSVLIVFRVTAMFAFPVWCLYLPLVLSLKDAEEGRIWTILSSGILIGPASVLLWCLFLQFRGGDPYAIWQGDPLSGLGGITATIFALIVGFLTTLFYAVGLKLLHRRFSVANDSCT